MTDSLSSASDSAELPSSDLMFNEAETEATSHSPPAHLQEICHDTDGVYYHWGIPG